MISMVIQYNRKKNLVVLILKPQGKSTTKETNISFITRVNKAECT
jgi:hypothetical protein